MPQHQNIRDVISSKKCGKCGGEANGWKCSQCDYTTNLFDASHWKDCTRGGKLKVKCKTCGEAEDNCTCQPQAS